MKTTIKIALSLALLLAMSACSLTDNNAVFSVMLNGSLQQATDTAISKSAASTATFTGVSTPLSCTVQTNVERGKLNIRSGPGTQYNVVAVLSEGEVLSVLALSGSWSKVETYNDVTGWVNVAYCK